MAYNPDAHVSVTERLCSCSSSKGLTILFWGRAGLWDTIIVIVQTPKQEELFMTKKKNCFEPNSPAAHRSNTKLTAYVRVRRMHTDWRYNRRERR